ncbi:hypothetical protein SLE2022_351290 [Rubroshorea leprosula]
MQSRGPGFDASTSRVAERQQDSCTKVDEYHVFRKKANEHRNLAGFCYEKAEVAYSEGERASLCNQGKIQTKLAQAAYKKASQDIFKARNKCIENEIEIDLHGQHCKEAVNILKQRLLCGGTHLASIQTLRVITGYGSHGVGNSVLKQSVIEFLDKESIKWSEEVENPGALLIKLDGRRKFSFQGTDSDTSFGEEKLQDRLILVWTIRFHFQIGIGKMKFMQVIAEYLVPVSKHESRSRS